MPKISGIERVKNALKQLKIETGQPMRKNFLNKVYLNRIKDAKLVLLSFVMNKSESSITEELITNHIKDFEKENGNLETLAEERLNDN